MIKRSCKVAMITTPTKAPITLPKWPPETGRRCFRKASHVRVCHVFAERCLLIGIWYAPERRDEGRRTSRECITSTLFPVTPRYEKILDEVVPEEFSSIYAEIFRQAQRRKVLEKLVFMEGCSLISVDGTQYFSSKKVHCPSCLEKTKSKTGEVTYSHQMLGAAIVHPDFQEVRLYHPLPWYTAHGWKFNFCITRIQLVLRGFSIIQEV